MSQIQTPITHTNIFRFLQYFTYVSTIDTKICPPNFKKIGRLVPKISRSKVEQTKNDVDKLENCMEMVLYLCLSINFLYTFVGF